MRGMNNVTIVGRVGQPPELRQSKSGNPWMRLNVATNRGVKKDGVWEEETDWHRVTLFGVSAERAMTLAKPGTLVGVEGSLTYDKWVDDDGNKRRMASIKAGRIEFLDNLRPRAEA